MRQLLFVVCELFLPVIVWGQVAVFNCPDTAPEETKATCEIKVSNTTRNDVNAIIRVSPVGDSRCRVLRQPEPNTVQKGQTYTTSAEVLLGSRTSEVITCRLMADVALLQKNGDITSITNHQTITISSSLDLYDQNVVAVEARAQNVNEQVNAQTSTTEYETVKAFMEDIIRLRGQYDQAKTSSVREAIIEELKSLRTEFTTDVKAAQQILQNNNDAIVAPAKDRLDTAWLPVQMEVDRAGYEQIKTKYNEANAKYAEFAFVANFSLSEMITELQRDAYDRLLTDTKEYNEHIIFPTLEDINPEENTVQTVPLDGVLGQRDDGVALLALFPQIARILIQISVPLILIGVVYVGITMITSSGNDEQIGKAKEYFQYLLIGVAAIVLSYTIVQAVYQFLVQ